MVGDEAEGLKDDYENNDEVVGLADLDLLLPVGGGVISGVGPGLDLLGDEADHLAEGGAGAGDQTDTLRGARVEVVSLAGRGVSGGNSGIYNLIGWDLLPIQKMFCFTISHLAHLHLGPGGSLDLCDCFTALR